MISKRVRKWCQRPGDNNDIPYFETSAKDATNVKEAFETVVRINHSVLNNSNISSLFTDDSFVIKEMVYDPKRKKNCKCQKQ